MRAQLVPIKGGNPIPILRDVTVIGRQKELCDIVLERSSISKLHCLLVRTDGLLFLRDLGSTNGTKVNGQRVVRGALLPGDELSFASEKYRVEMGPSVPEPVEDIHEAHTEELVAPVGLLGGLAQDPGGHGTGHDSESDVRPLG
jgi:pSer/pThr/pTyr-binding forkhead associated (FHA) protein